jgi:type II secretory pathway component PulC
MKKLYWLYAVIIVVLLVVLRENARLRKFSRNIYDPNAFPIKQGSQSEQVKALQRWLNLEKGENLKITGIYDQPTQTATAKYVKSDQNKVTKAKFFDYQMHKYLYHE